MEAALSADLRDRLLLAGLPVDPPAMMAHAEQMAQKRFGGRHFVLDTDGDRYRAWAGWVEFWASTGPDAVARFLLYCAGPPR